MSKYVNVRVGPRVTLTDDEQRAVAQLHSDLRRQLAEDHGQRVLEGDAWRLADIIRVGGVLSVADLATLCRALAWDLEAFYSSLGADYGDYAKLIRLNDNVYFDAGDGWDT